MKILILSYEVWQNENNGGNVLSDIFRNFQECEFAQIYCSNGYPNNNICKKYYRLNDNDIIYHHGRGEEFVKGDIQNPDDSLKNIKVNKRHFRYFKLFVRELLWSLSNWKNNGLLQFVENFSPDLVFAPCYGIPHMNKIGVFLSKHFKVPFVSYVSDDGYSFVDRPTPFYLAYQCMTRKSIRKFLKVPVLTYTMTKEQMNEYSNKFKIKMKILRKEIAYNNRIHVNSEQKKFIYAGGLYLGRSEVLLEVIKAIEKNSKSSKQKVIFDIYSSSFSSEFAQKIKLYDFVELKQLIPYKQLVDEYKKYDYALHVESFLKYHKKATRLSFSTKITDCLNSGCIFIAIGPKENAGINFLEDNNLAFTIREKNDISESLTTLLNGDFQFFYDQNLANYCESDENRTYMYLKEDFGKIINKEK